MPDRSVLQAARILTCVLVFLSFSAQSQQDPLYRVELLVFSTSAGGAAEQWEATPELAYPGTARFLTSAEEQAVAEQQTAQTLTPAPAQHSAFVMLPPTQRELGAKAAAMQRSGRYRILFHEVWDQPMTGNSAAEPIILDRSGDGGPWPMLQGTIKVYLAGYFYLDTNLWLNTQGEYLPGIWRMPAPPRAPASHPVESLSPMEPALPEAAPSQPDTTQLANTAQLEVPVSSDYPYRHAVLLKQSRRMRSGQLNYIDHPLLGVLVKITPLSEPAPAPTNM